MAQNPMSRHSKIVAGMLPALIILFFILGLAGVVGPALERSVTPDPAALARDQLEAIATAFHEYHDELGEWPSVGESDRFMQAMHSAYVTGFSCLRKRPESAQHWRGPYLRPTPSPFDRDRDPCVDPWDRGFRIYRFPAHTALGGQQGKICAVSLGPNGKLETPLAGITSGFTSGDDLVRVIFR